MNCYITGEPCDCGAFDVAGECPRDEYVHDEDIIDDDLLDDAHELLKGLNHGQED